MAINVHFDLSSYDRLDWSVQSAVGRRFSRASAFYLCSPLAMYGNNITQHVGVRRSFLYRVLVPKGQEPVARQIDAQQWKRRFGRILRVTYGHAYRVCKRSYTQVRRHGSRGLRAVARCAMTIVKVYANLIRFALLGLPSEKRSFYFDTRCDHWHRKGA